MAFRSGFGAFGALVLLAACADHPPVLTLGGNLSALVLVENDQGFRELVAECRDAKSAASIEAMRGFFCHNPRFVAVRVRECSMPTQMSNVFCHEFAHVGGWEHQESK